MPKCSHPAQFGPTIQRLTKLQMASKGIGCDLDGDGKTDNALASALAAFLSQINASWDKAVLDGSFVMLLEALALPADGQNFTLRLLLGRPVPSAACAMDLQLPACQFTVEARAYNLGKAGTACTPVNALSDCKVAGSQLLCSDKLATVPLTLPVAGLPCWQLALVVSHAQLQATVGAQPPLSLSKGLLCGVVPASAFGGTLVGTLLKPDVDVDGDGLKESASVAFVWDSVPAQIAGMTPPP